MGPIGRIGPIGQRKAGPRMKHDAVLLLGPTGAGKSPLGALLETRGWRGRRCVHFDFGENLRGAVARGQPDEIVSADDLVFLRRVLESRALLEDKDFPIAARILQSFLKRRSADAQTVVVLNGLPRHVGQADDVAQLLDVRTVIWLACMPETVLARIAANTGGDRTYRVDDDLAAVQQKLSLFAARTQPLIDYYRAHAAQVLRIDVTAEMTPEAMWRAVTATGSGVQISIFAATRSP